MVAKLSPKAQCVAIGQAGQPLRPLQALARPHEDGGEGTSHVSRVL